MIIRVKRAIQLDLCTETRCLQDQLENLVNFTYAVNLLFTEKD
jgi:hypothetical protein